VIYVILRPPEYLEDARERELEMQAAEARLHELEHALCPHCSYPIERDFVRCPSCLRKLKERCVACQRPLDQAWTICPYCETEVPGAIAPARRRRRRRQAASEEEEVLIGGEGSLGGEVSRGRDSTLERDSSLTLEREPSEIELPAVASPSGVGEENPQGESVAIPESLSTRPRTAGRARRPRPRPTDGRPQTE
jgi:Double zinc ribbon